MLAYLRFVQQVARQAKAAGLSPLEAARATDLGEFKDLLDSERIVGNLHRAYLELDGAEPGDPVDFVGALADMVAYHGGPPVLPRLGSAGSGGTTPPNPPEKTEKMAWLNEEIAALLREYAELTQITGGDVFRARNYEKAARSVRGWGDDIGPLGRQGPAGHTRRRRLDRGQDRRIPRHRRDQGAGGAAGPDTARGPRADQGARPRAQTGPAAQPGPGRRVGRRPRGGDRRRAGWTGWPGSAARAGNGSPAASRCTGRDANGSCSNVASRTATTHGGGADRAVPGCQRCTYAGSLRRMAGDVGDVDILAAADDSAPLMAAFVGSARRGRP